MTEATKPGEAEKAAREAKLAQALRANLRRRKAAGAGADGKAAAKSDGQV